ncbi:polymerase [Bacillus cereus]|uniref:polymerase n=1 Tax=Bacillus cereus TaxID=1396 RepID=UPI0024BC4FE3|nr:polymerase [Bacillus cereus]WHT89667.1 polymerase [Bacillus cereus]
MNILMSIKKDNIIAGVLLIVLLSVIIGIVSLYPIVIAVFFVLIFVFSIIIFITSKPHRFIYLLMLYIVLQNSIAMLLAKYIGGSIPQLFILLKDILTYAALVIMFVYNFKKFKATFVDVLAFISTVCLGIYLVVPTDAALFTKLVQFRQLMSPIALYLLGRFLFIKKERADEFLKFFVKISVMACIFGFLERFILGDSFWVNIGIVEYMHSKGMGNWAYAAGGLPGNFYTFDFVAFIGTSLRRMVSFIADPTLFGQYLVFPLAILVFTHMFSRKKTIFYFVILIIALLLSLSKGGMLSFAIVVLFKVFRSKYRPLGFVLMSFLGAVLVVILSNAEKFSSLPSHLKGLTHNFTVIADDPFGLGLGMAGNFANLYASGNNDEIGAGESFIGMIVGQLGLFSILIFLFFIIIVHFFRKNKNKDIYIRDFSNLMAATLIGTLCSSIISESAISFISAGIIFLMSGVFVTIKSEYKSEAD